MTASYYLPTYLPELLDYGGKLDVVYMKTYQLNDYLLASRKMEI
jgi:hypothetical protein